MATLLEGVGLDIELSVVEQPTNMFLIDWNSKQIAGLNDGLEAMRQAVDIILQNERFRWQIYDSNFGTELEDLPGEEYAYITSELPRRVEEAFSVDSRIISVDNWSFQDRGCGVLAVSFEVVTVFGTVNKEVAL